MPHPWDEAPVWTTVDAVKLIAPHIYAEAESRVRITDPVDLAAAAHAFLEACIVDAQAYLIGGIQQVYDGPESIATTYEETPGDLRLYTKRRAAVQVYTFDTGGGGLPPAIQAIADSVDAWLGGLRQRHVFKATAGPDDEDAPRSTPPRRTRAPASSARSPLAARAQELLG